MIEVGEVFHKMDAPATAQAAAGYDKVYNRIVGGLQIAPTGANWVGTGGGVSAATFNGNNIYGALTNAHVTGLHAAIGKRMMQPDDSYPRGAFSTVAWVSKFSPNNDNTVDAAILNCDSRSWAGAETDWWAGNPRCTMLPEQFGGFKLSGRWRDPVVGDKATKWGRTTGETDLECVAINATDYVNYGPSDGTFGFIKMSHWVGVGGVKGSAGGDSGSFLVDRSTGDFIGHLFAGGGNITICYVPSSLAAIIPSWRLRDW